MILLLQTAIMQFLNLALHQCSAVDLDTVSVYVPLLLHIITTCMRGREKENERERSRERNENNAHEFLCSCWLLEHKSWLLFLCFFLWEGGLDGGGR